MSNDRVNFRENIDDSVSVYVGAKFLACFERTFDGNQFITDSARRKVASEKAAKDFARGFLFASTGEYVTEEEVGRLQFVRQAPFPLARVA